MSQPFSIQLSGLKEGRHILEFEIGDGFFELFEESEVKEGSLVAVVEMEKRRTHADLNIRITGSVQVCCDRCLEMFSLPVDCENRLLVRLGKTIGGDDPDIISLPAEENELDMSQHFYDYIHLALPIRRIHPGKAGKPDGCNPEMTKRLETLRSEEENQGDPRWDELKKLMNDN